MQSTAWAFKAVNARMINVLLIVFNIEYLCWAFGFAKVRHPGAQQCPYKYGRCIRPADVSRGTHYTVISTRFPSGSRTTLS